MLLSPEKSEGNINSCYAKNTINIIRDNISENNFTRWRRLIGSPTLQIISHKRATKYRSLLRKITYKDKASYESSSPCSHCACTFAQPREKSELRKKSISIIYQHKINFTKKIYIYIYTSLVRPCRIRHIRTKEQVVYMYIFLVKLVSCAHSIEIYFSHIHNVLVRPCRILVRPCRIR